MGKKSLNLFLLFIMAFVMFASVGCSKTTHRIYESGYFEYVIVGKRGNFPKNKEDQVVAIIRLTELGQEQETIDIPLTIDGKEVWYIGFRIIKGLMGGNRPYEFSSPNLKKMYIHDNIIGIDNEILRIENQWDVMLCSVDYNRDLDWAIYKIDLIDIVGSINGNIYIYKFLYDKTVEDLQQSGRSNPWYGERILPANVVFLNNYSDEINSGYYRLDYVISGNKITPPPIPEREGYEFTGWFTDVNCLNIWNFGNEIEIENGDEFRLYAGWEQKK